jgi:hypothetical protein
MRAATGLFITIFTIITLLLTVDMVKNSKDGRCEDMRYIDFILPSRVIACALSEPVKLK